MADFEDHGDKIRRNLVVFSAAVVLSAWLRVSLSGFIAKAVADGHLTEPLSAARIWGAVLVVWLYLCQRYWYADETQQTWQRFQAARTSRLVAQQKALVERALRNGMSGPGPAFLNESLDIVRARNAQVIAHDQRLEPTLTFVDNAVPTPLAGVITMNMEFAGREPHVTIARVPYTIAGNPRRMLVAKSWCFEAIDSAYTTELLVPLTLALAAGGVIVAKLVIAAL